MSNKKDKMFSDNLIKYRKLRGLSQEELAQRSELSRRMIAYYETTPSNPPVRNVFKLAEALEISIYDLIQEEKNEAFNMFKDIDTRTIKKIMEITKLPKKDRTTIYNMIDALVEKNKQSN